MANGQAWFILRLHLQDPIFLEGLFDDTIELEGTFKEIEELDALFEESIYLDGEFSDTILLGGGFPVAAKNKRKFMHAGEDRVLIIPIRNPKGEPVSLTSAIFEMDGLQKSTANATIQIKGDNNDIINIPLLPIDTKTREGEKKYEIRGVNTAGKSSVLSVGTIYIEASKTV